ncbi:MAG: hypothetical protein ABIH78_02300 [Candidatus Peregrinibacteria bacterium]
MSKKLFVGHGDFDGVASVALLAKQHGISADQIRVIFTQPFLVDKVKIPDDIEEIYVVDIAVNNRDVDMTRRFYESLGDRLKVWYDHHEGWHTEEMNNLTTAQGGKVIAQTARACAAMLASSLDQLVQDAIAADTRKGELSSRGQLIEQATKANIKDDTIRVAAAKWLLGDESQKAILDKAAEKYAAIQKKTERLATTFAITGNVAVIDTRNQSVYGSFDMTQLLLAGQKKASFAVALFTDPKKKEDRVIIATQSGKNLVELFGLPSGAPFRVDLEVARLPEAMEKLNEEEGRP